MGNGGAHGERSMRTRRDSDERCGGAKLASRRYSATSKRQQQMQACADRESDRDARWKEQERARRKQRQEQEE